MKQATFLLLMIVLYLSSCNESIDKPLAESQYIETVAAHFVPDKRVNRFEVNARKENGTLILKGETSLQTAKDSLFRQLNELQIHYIDSIIVWPHPALGEKTYGLVRHSVANIRSEPKHSAELATQALLGTPLLVFKKEGDWYLVQTPDGYISWLDSGGLSLLTKAEWENWQTQDRVIFLGSNTISLVKSETNSSVVGDLATGGILVRQAKGEFYSQVQYPDQRVAYIPNEQLMSFDAWLNNRNLDVQQFCATAKSMTGHPYLWGGTSNKGADCSGFTKTVYWLNGFIIPRDASQQVHAGISVELTDNLNMLEVGDFLFFGRYREDGSEKITHVGIYLGEGRFIHSGADNGAVKEENLFPDEENFAPHRRASLLKVKRLLEGSEKVIAIRDHSWY